jgi:hypothetical protein
MTSSLSQKERLRATVRGALNTRNEADISDSTFLGRATSSPARPPQTNSAHPVETDTSVIPGAVSLDTSTIHNPVDEM